MAVTASARENNPQYQIEATGGLRESRTRILKQDDTFAVLNHFGDMIAEPGSPDGLYRHDTRFLSELELRLNGDRPLLLSSNAVECDSILSVDLANTDTRTGDGSALRRELIYIHRRQFIWRSAYYELLLIRNYDLRRHVLRLDIRFGADFADIFEIRGQRRPRRGVRLPPRKSTDSTELRYRALDGVEYTTRLSFSPQPAQLNDDAATFLLDLGPSEWSRLAFRCECDGGAATNWTVREFYRAVRAERHAFHSTMADIASVSSSDRIFNELTRRSMADVYMLCTGTEQGPYPCAGIPWFSTPFGRDGLITALLMLWVDPEIAKGVLSFLAAAQATDVDPARDAEPGKILHEMRNGEMARLGEVPFGRYYGSADATPLFVMLMGEYFSRTGDVATVRRLWPNLKAALHWIDHYGDADGDGFVEYYRKRGSGLENQGWKDSADAIFHANAELAEGPIALCEVQAYVFAAKRHAAVLARALGEADTADRLESEAEDLRRRFEAAFWCDELATYAIALDGDKRPCRVVASNAGHALLAGIATPERAAKVAATLMRYDCFSGWGIRTLSRTAPRYNPISYHNGSVWPHDNALIALGFARYDLKEPVERVLTGLFEAACYWDPRRLPELFCGFVKRRSAPTLYPVACSPQAWASAAVFGLLRASIGISFDPAADEVRFDRPRLPPFLERLQIRGLRLGGRTTDITLQRLGSEVAATVNERHDKLRVVVVH